MLKVHRNFVRSAGGGALFSHPRTAVCAIVLALNGASACSHERPPPPPPVHSAPSAAEAPRSPVDAGTPPPREIGPVRVTLGHGAELYLPPWFAAKKGGYDLIVHFHGVGRWQEANIEHAKLNVAVVSVNLGAGTEPYSKAFKRPEAFDRLLASVQTEIGKSGAGENVYLKRVALSAWSAGFSSVARVLTESVAQRVDAVLLADGFFTSFAQPTKRRLNTSGLEKFARFAESARRDDKLFMITHTTIPTGPYPSVQECVTKLLEMISVPKTPAVATGPRNMHQFYVVDQGSLHIRGFKGTQAVDHVRQLHAMGETMYPYLKSRWEKQDAEDATVSAADGGVK
jgi:hypothetical protein